MPIAIKDHLPIKDFLCTFGLVARTSKSVTKDCEYISVLRKAGAIFFVTTNCGQMAASFTTESKVWGNAVNPYNASRTCGGSSGGSAGIVATKGVCIAIGTDIAGSIRYPAAWCGVYAFKPTNSRISKKDTMDIDANCDLTIDRELSVSIGPLGKCVDDLALICEAIFGKFINDPLHNA